MNKLYKVFAVLGLVLIPAVAFGANSANFYADFSLPKFAIGQSSATMSAQMQSTTATSGSQDLLAIQNTDGASADAACSLFVIASSTSGWTNGLTRVCGTRTSAGGVDWSLTQSPGSAGAPAQTLKIQGADGGQLQTSTGVVVNCSTSGTVTYYEPQQGTIKMVAGYAAACVGTASWTFTTAFAHTPVVRSTNGLATTKVTSLSTTAATFTGSTDTGPFFIDGL